jgi:Ca2+-binding RTX toxin-like protein
MVSLMKPLGGEFTVNATTSGMQWFHSVAALTTGGFITVWIDDSRTGGDPSGYSIKARKVNSDGAFLGGEFLVNQVTEGDQLEPFVTGLANGGFVVVWLGNNFQTTIKGRVFDAAGNGGAEFLVDTNNSVYGLDLPHAFALANGGFVLSWSERTNETSDAKAQIFDAAGSKVGGEFAVHAGAGGQSAPDGTALANGNFVISWTDQSDSNTPGDVKARIFDPNGVPLTGDFHLATDRSGFESTPELTALTGGGFAAVWQGYNSVAQRHEARVQVFDASGTMIGSEIVAGEPGASPHHETSIASFSWGGFVVAWVSLSGGAFGHEKAVRAQLFDPEGNKIGGIFDLNSQPQDSGSRLEIAVTADDRLVATWEYGNYDVKARIFASPIAGTAAGDILQGTNDADSLVGLGGDDSIYGLGGDDIIDGGPGMDTLYGGAGNDTYIALGSETIVELAGEGTDTVETAIASFSIEGVAHVENLVGTARTGQSLTGNGLSNEIVGGIGADSLFGLGDNDLLRGGAGNDVLDGGAGADEMQGGLGADVYIVDDAGDVVVETGFDRDRVETALAAYTLASGAEDLTGTSALGQTLTGNFNFNTIVGGEGNDVISGGESDAADTLRGNGGDDVLRGEDGNDILSGGAGNDELDGGAGYDEMTGGSGDDVYVFDHQWDDAIEAVNGGIDEVRSASAFVTIEFSPNVEKLTALSAAGQNMFGNAEANLITGGAGQDFLAGNGGDDILVGGDGNDTLRGGDGIDSYEGGGDDRTAAGSGAFGDRITFNEARATQGAFADLRTQSVTNDGFGNAETMTGIESIGGDTAFADTFHGTDAANGFVTGFGGDKVYGHGGDDRFEMGTAAALVDGGEGTDLLFLRSTGGFLRPDANGDGLADMAPAMPGSWTVDLANGTMSDGYGSSGALANIENVTGSAAADTIMGNDGANVLGGGAGHDRIVGRGGADTLSGGSGGDRFVYESVSDSAAAARDRILDFQSGIDLLDVSALAPSQVVLSQAMDGAVAYTLVTVTSAAGTAEIRVEGSITAADVVTEGAAPPPGPRPIIGTAGDDVLEGTAESDIIQGLAGNDTLRGLASADLLEGGDGNDLLVGGDGADTMRGGAGDDVYVVAQAGDLAEENAGEGADEIHTSLASFSLAALVNIENLTGTAFGTQMLTGNALANRIRSGFGDDLLDGGAGADHLEGGHDNDVYIVDDLGDVVVENQHSGYDEIRTALAAYSLVGTANVEKLTGTSASGQALTGNAESNFIQGAAGNDVIRGGGGNDQLQGGAGDDLYFLETHDAHVVEAAGGGTDEIRTALSAYALAANVENLTGTSATGQLLSGNGLDNILFGGMGDDTLNGNAGNDILIGFGGSDVLRGQAGDDVYIIDAGDTVVELAGDGIDEVRTQAEIFVLTGAIENLRANSDIGHDFRGNGLNNVIVGAAGNDVFRAHDGGGDLLFGLGGVDSFYMGGAFDNGDLIDGGENRDSLILQGDYAAGLTLTWDITGGSSIANIEGISLLSGSVTHFGQSGTNLYSYNLTLVDGNIASGALMKINGFNLQAGENFTLNASAETDAPLQVFASFGTDNLTGGQQGDAFIFGHDGRLGAGDRVDGGGGYDVVYLRGDYTLDFNAAGFETAFTNVESLAILTSANSEFAGGGDGDFDYTITWADALLAAGATFTVNASRLQAHETFVFDGSKETDGVLRVFGGASADTLTGGGSSTQLHGGGGADVLNGGAGTDLFRYSNVGDSNAAATDTVQGFVAGTDKIDVGRVDAKASTSDLNEAFIFIGSNAFSAAGPNAPGQLRTYNVSGDLWRVEGDVNGDGIADLVIDVHVEAGQPLTAGDFIV